MLDGKVRIWYSNTRADRNGLFLSCQNLLILSEK